MTEHSDEAALEPRKLISQSGAILRMGSMMLSAGTASYRVKQAMQAASRALGITRHVEAVSLTEITATTHRGNIFRTEVTEVRQVTINADRITELDRMRRSLKPDESSTSEIHSELDRIAARGALYPGWANAAFAGLACAGFATLNNAGPWEVLVVAIAAALGQFARRSLAHRHFNHFGSTLIAAATSAVSYAGLLALLSLALPQPIGAAESLVSAVLYLVPGFAIVTGALDIAKMDFSAGIGRTVFATMIMVAAGMSVWGVTAALGMEPALGDPYALSDPWLWTMRVAASAAGVFGFAMMFNSPARMATAAALIGTVGNLVRLSLLDAGASPQMAVVVGCLLIGLGAAVAAKILNSPNIILSVPAILIMIPGVPAYHAIIYMNSGETLVALAAGVQATFTLLSIVIGLIIAKLFVDREWAFEQVRS